MASVISPVLRHADSDPEHVALRSAQSSWTYAQLRDAALAYGEALRKQGITLRVRRVNGAFLQTIKREAGSNLFDRGEWENEIRGAEPDRSAFAGTPVEDILRANGADTLKRLSAPRCGAPAGL